MDTSSAFEIIAVITALAGLAAPVAVLMERTHRRARRENGTRTTWAPTRHDADTRRITDELTALQGTAHR